MKLCIRRPPDFIVGGQDNPYLLRWHIVRTRWLSIYLHKFVRDDDDRAMHDHPWPSVSIVLSGGYYDVHPGPDGTEQRRWYGPGSVIFRRATSRHRVELAESRQLVPRDDLPFGVPLEWDEARGCFVAFRNVHAWTLLFCGPRVREWGFWCPKGWVHWRRFTTGRDGELIGKGCDQ